LLKSLDATVGTIDIDSLALATVGTIDTKEVSFIAFGDGVGTPPTWGGLDMRPLAWGGRLDVTGGSEEPGGNVGRPPL
jgi:hypothetical protein